MKRLKPCCNLFIVNINNKYPLLVSSDWLEKNYSAPHLRIFDCTVWLKPQEDKIYKIFSGKNDYEKEHIPYSSFLDILELSHKKSSYDFMMPTFEVFESFMSSLGVGPNKHVILYSRGNIQWATRVWWMFKSVNFLNVSILDGGFDKWKIEKRKVTRITKKYSKDIFISKPTTNYFCNKEEVLDNINNKKVCIINALRKSLHYANESIHYGRPGHIKNSINIPSTEMVDKNSYIYKPYNELINIFDKHNILSKERVITYCGAGIAATNIAFALTKIGYENVTVYDASLNEWSNDYSLPLEI